MFYNKDVGKRGEKVAEDFLRKKGYLFISRNYWTENGEIDLIFYRKQTLVFVEVKTRKNSDFGTGREAVDFSKRRCIKNTSKDFMRSHCEGNKVPFYIWKIPFYMKFQSVRYDVIEVSAKTEKEYEIYSHLIDYFR